MLREEVGGAGALHALVPEPSARREVWHLTVDAPALVLGSTQADTVDPVAAAVAGISVVRRRSGGGAVLLIPGESTWIDVVVPRGDAVWDDDITRSFAWLGEVWVETLQRVGLAAADLSIHAGGLVRGEHGAAVCFAGIGPGEVTAAGSKVVGLSQRRTRDFARFQCTVHRVWRPEGYRELLATDIGADATLPPVGTVDVETDLLVETFCRVLATA